MALILSSKNVLTSALLASCFALAACGQTGSARQVLGLDRQSPDAFSVRPHAALEIPADMTTLPKPQLGAPRPQETTAEQEAREALQTASTSSNTTSAGEQALLAQAGAAEQTTSADLRAQLDKEAEEDAKSQKHPLAWLAFWRKDEGPGVVVDAQAEADRLAKARAAGESPVATATPVIPASGQMNAPTEIK